jgi:hypothetical protein
MRSVETTTTPYGRRALKGTCLVCGAELTKILP